jgi:hypothetical protein
VNWGTIVEAGARTENPWLSIVARIYRGTGWEIALDKVLRHHIKSNIHLLKDLLYEFFKVEEHFLNVNERVSVKTPFRRAWVQLPAIQVA